MNCLFCWISRGTVCSKKIGKEGHRVCRQNVWLVSSTIPAQTLIGSCCWCMERCVLYGFTSLQMSLLWKFVCHLFIVNPALSVKSSWLPKQGPSPYCWRNYWRKSSTLGACRHCRWCRYSNCLENSETVVCATWSGTCIRWTVAWDYCLCVSYAFAHFFFFCTWASTAEGGTVSVSDVMISLQTTSQLLHRYHRVTESWSLSTYSQKV